MRTRLFHLGNTGVVVRAVTDSRGFVWIEFQTGKPYLNPSNGGDDEKLCCALFPPEPEPVVEPAPEVTE